jgi:hypothetical protein
VSATPPRPAAALLDGTPVTIGLDVRCVLRVTGKAIRFGEVLAVVGRGAHGVDCVRRDGLGVTLTPEEMGRCFRPARLGTLTEHSNSHYAARPVLVLLNTAPRFAPLAALYTALGLGASVNVTVLANRNTMAAAADHLDRVLRSQRPDVPPLWHDLVKTLAGRATLSKTKGTE